jgi:hypothetical protein
MANSFQFHSLGWSDGNTGRRGLENFSTQHECNKICHHLGLKRPEVPTLSFRESFEKIYGATSGESTHIPGRN